MDLLNEGYKIECKSCGAVYTLSVPATTCQKCFVSGKCDISGVVNVLNGEW